MNLSLPLLLLLPSSYPVPVERPTRGHALQLDMTTPVAPKLRGSEGGFRAVTPVEQPQPKVHAVFVFDTHAPGIGPGIVPWDRFNMLRTFHGGFRDAGQESRLVWSVLSEEKATPRNVIDAINSLRPAPGDTVLVYYAGHGAVDSSRGHFLNMRHGMLYRSSIQTAMARHKVRLSVLLTESCAVVIPSPYHKSMKPGGPATGNWQVLNTLLFESQGKVDINSSSPRQVALGSTATGGFFTHYLAEVLCREPRGKVSWEIMLDQAERGLWQVIPKERQETYAYALSVREGGAATPQRIWQHQPQHSQEVRGMSRERR